MFLHFLFFELFFFVTLILMPAIYTGIPVIEATASTLCTSSHLNNFLFCVYHVKVLLNPMLLAFPSKRFWELYQSIERGRCLPRCCGESAKSGQCVVKRLVFAPTGAACCAFSGLIRAGLKQPVKPNTTSPLNTGSAGTGTLWIFLVSTTAPEVSGPKISLIAAVVMPVQRHRREKDLLGVRVHTNG